MHPGVAAHWASETSLHAPGVPTHPVLEKQATPAIWQAAASRVEQLGPPVHASSAVSNAHPGIASQLLGSASKIWQSMVPPPQLELIVQPGAEQPVWSEQSVRVPVQAPHVPASQASVGSQSLALLHEVRQVPFTQPNPSHCPDAPDEHERGPHVSLLHRLPAAQSVSWVQNDMQTPYLQA